MFLVIINSCTILPSTHHFKYIVNLLVINPACQCCFIKIGTSGFDSYPCCRYSMDSSFGLEKSFLGICPFTTTAGNQLEIRVCFINYFVFIGYCLFVSILDLHEHMHKYQHIYNFHL